MSPEEEALVMLARLLEEPRQARAEAVAFVRDRAPGLLVERARDA